MKSNDKNERRYSRLYHTLKTAAGPACHLIFGIRKENEIRLPEEPCLVVANHTCYFDPLILAMYVNQPLRFVTGENLLRHKLAAFLAVDVFHSIPCAKGKMNAGTILNISRSIKSGHYVCMFAEGNITYDGATAPLASVNGKLFRALKCTVATVTVSGAYQVIPRWSRRFCRGNITAQLKGVYTKDMLQDMTPEEIVEHFNQDLYIEQPAPDTRKVCRRSARGIHYVLYACPECHALGKITGKGRKIRCSECGKTWDYNKYGEIDGDRFRTIWQWNQWQTRWVREIIRSKENIRISNQNANLYQIADNHKRNLLASGMLLLDRAVLSVGNRVFPLQSIFRMDTRNKGILLFSTKNEDYYEITVRKGFSGLMYKTFFEALA